MTIFDSTVIRCLTENENQQKAITELIDRPSLELSFHTAMQASDNEGFAVIWLIVLDAHSRLNSLEHFHGNHESIVYIQLDKSMSLDGVLKFPCFHIEDPISQLFHLLISEEQKILQRNDFLHAGDTVRQFDQVNLYGRSKAFVETTKLIRLIAKNEASVFIKGETGTGKELTARAIHYSSSRKTSPFIPINCGAFNDDLILSELFGYEKGAFTGAIKAKQGLLEVADTGTVFLDEVDSLSPKAQVALLRFLQDSEIRPVGSHSIKKVNVRVIAASNCHVNSLVEQGDFREDLLYRLDVLGIQLPPLRQRQDDIQLLAQHFLAKLAVDNGHYTKTFSQNVINAMVQYSWPGNIRELENFILRAYCMTDGELIEDLSLLFGGSQAKVRVESLINIDCLTEFNGSFHKEKQRLICNFEKDYIHQLLSRTQGNVSQAATIAQKERRSFCRLMEKYGLQRKSYLQ
jgi:DNA-binding NtrC family response regulator